MNPRAAINDLLPFQGSPFGQLGYFSKLPYLLSSSDIYLYRSQRQVILYLVSFMLSSTFLTFFKSFFIMYLTSGESGIRTHAPLRTNGFQDRLVMTTSISLHIYNCLALIFRFSVSASDILAPKFLDVNNFFTFFSSFIIIHPESAKKP